MGLQLVSCSLFSVSHAVMRRARGVLHQEEYERFANAEAGKPTGVKSNEAWVCVWTVCWIFATLEKVNLINVIYA